MRDIQELQQTLDDHAALAPDGAGMVEAAQTGAVKIRRRRRLVYGATALAVTALVAVTGVVIPRLLAGPPDDTATPAPYREPIQLTVVLAPSRDYHVMNWGTDAYRQFLEIRSTDPADGDLGGAAYVYDPGTFNPAQLLRGEKVTVSGHIAYYVSGYVIGTVKSLPGQTKEVELRLPAVGWQDRSGPWVLVLGTAHARFDRADLLRMAGFVRLGPPRDILFPYHLTYIPDDLPGSYAKVRVDPASNDSILALATDREPIPAGTADVGAPLKIQVYPQDAEMWPAMIADMGSPTHQIAGYDVWYLTDRQDFLHPPQGSSLIVNAGNCAVMVTVADRNQITFDELTQMIEGAQFKNCTDRRTWTGPLS